jgi:hypothetical protein
LAREPAKARRWIGLALSGVAVLFVAFDVVLHIWAPQPVADSMTELGWPVGLAPVLGTLELACLALYLVPRTSILGAVLFTGYLGGAIATNLRVGKPLLGFVLFPLYLALMLWGGLWLRDARLRVLLPVEREATGG